MSTPPPLLKTWNAHVHAHRELQSINISMQDYFYLAGNALYRLRRTGLKLAECGIVIEFEFPGDTAFHVAHGR